MYRICPPPCNRPFLAEQAPVGFQFQLCCRAISFTDSAMKLSSFFAVLMAGVASCAAQVVTYPAPEGEVLSRDFQIDAGEREVAVYAARVLDPPFDRGYDYGGNYSFANFDLSGPAEVRIRSARSLSNLVVRPASAGVQIRVVASNTAVLWFPGPRKVSIEPDGKKSPLLLFANPHEAEKPAEGAPGVVHFGPGIHHAGKITLTNGQWLHLAGGAIVKGGILAQGNDIRITGRGILDGNDWEWRKGPTPHVISIRGTNVEVSGITIRGASHWTIVPQSSRHVTVRDVKLCGGRVQNDDGINPCNSQDVLITDCFIRSDDDCVALKGLDLNARPNNVEGITVENSVLWCDRARIFLLGHESRADYMRDIVLRNLDIIHFTMTPFLFEPGEEMRLQNVLIEDVRLHGEGQREFIRLKPVVNQYMHKKVPGHVSDIQFRNVKIEGKPGPYLVQLEGADTEHVVRNVSFDNVEVIGEPLSANSKPLKTNADASAIRFAPADRAVTSQNASGEIQGWRSFHETPGTKTSDVWRLTREAKDFASVPVGYEPQAGETPVLLCKGTPRGYLYTERQFTNAIISLEWRYPQGTRNGRGGALVRTTGPDAIWPRCLEFQFNQAGAGDFWAIRDFSISGPITRTLNDPAQGVLRHVQRFADREKPAGEWNSFEGIIDGGTAVQKLNGRTVSEASGCEIIPGRILLTSEGTAIEFRNIRITPLP